MKKMFFLLIPIIFFFSCEKTTTGFIDIKSTPTGAEVYLDDKDTGKKTDVTLTNIEEGIHQVKLILADYKEWSKDVEVKAGETTYVEATLEQNTTEQAVSIILVEDSIFSTSDTTGMHEFPFYLKNITENDISTSINMTTDFPNALWYASLCDSSNCYPLPHNVDIAPFDSVFFDVTVGFASSGDGTAILNVGCLNSTVTQTFIVKAGQ